jgi:integrase
MGRTDYLFQRAGSRNWHVRFQGPTGRTERSLGTSDRRQAELLALPLIAEHKAALLAARPRMESIWARTHTPGLHVGPDGQKIFATPTELHHLDSEGRTVRVEANGAPTKVYWLRPGLTAEKQMANFRRAETDERRALVTKTGDDAILEIYLKHANVTGHFEREARDTWALFRSLTSSKPLKDCDRNDGRKLVDHLAGRGLKSATIQKKVMWLNAAVNLAIKENRLRFNPFSSIVPKRNDKQKRLPLTDADIKATKHHLGELAAADQVLFRLLASSGLRLSEAFEIDGEAKERGVRYVIIGKKTPQSERRVPLPAAVLPYLPAIIKGRLFGGGAPAASKRLMRFLRGVGIVDPRKVVHSLRHRAQDRLRACACPEDIRWALLGHEEESVATGYGEGFPVPMLKKWIDRIGF